MKKLALILALFAFPAFGAGREQLLLNAIYDLDATDPTYCVTTGVGGQVRSGAIPVDQLVTTSGSSTTVAVVASTADPFLNVAVGDILIFPRTYSATTGGIINTREERVVTARASADSITVNAAIELPVAGTTFSYREPSCGTAATSGWVPVQNLSDVTFTINIAQLSVGSGGVAVTVECRNLGVGAGANTIFAPTAYTTTGVRSFIIVEPWSECRVGIELSGADDGSDTGADAEQITIQMVARVEE